MNETKPFMNIREACNYTGLSQRFLRDGCKSGTIPHLMSGNVYMINVKLLMNTLDDMSQRNIKGPQQCCNTIEGQVCGRSGMGKPQDYCIADSDVNQ